MTPTEQDKELREKIADLFDELCEPTNKFWHRDSGLYWASKVMQLITADRKRVALEARLNGKWEILSKIPDGTSVLEDGKIGSAYELRIKVNREIAELKAQQEEV